MIEQLTTIFATLRTEVLSEALSAVLSFALAPALALLLQGDYGFWAPIISTLKGIGLALSGVGLMVAILIKGAAGVNGDRHAYAARVAEGVFAGLFVVLLGWFIYDRMVEWTPL
jgi:hypothetical protein